MYFRLTANVLTFEKGNSIHVAHIRNEMTYVQLSN